MATNLRLYYPCKPWLAFQGFGECHPAICSTYKAMGLLGHNGIDAQAADSTPLYAAHDGTVVFAGEDGSAGFGVVIRTDEQYAYKGGQAYFKTIYWHLRRDGIRVRAGQKVKTGDLIALSDNTGISTGAHLHFGLKPVHQGEQEWVWFNIEQDAGYKGAVDPQPYFVGIYAQDVPNKIAQLRAIVARLTQQLAELLAKR